MLARDGWDDFAHLFGGTWLQAVAALDASGEASFPRVHGDELWAWLAAHPDERAAFDRAMAQGDRCRFVEGSFFELVPHGDVHLLSTILHDWDDDSAQRILETVRAAAGERLVALDGVIEPGNAPDGAKWLDLLMLVIAGGRERTAEQWRVLLGNAG